MRNNIPTWRLGWQAIATVWQAVSPFCFCGLFAAVVLGQVEETEPLTPIEQLETFQLPPGFEIQLVASEPDIAKPMNLAFDARGRLWVSSSTEYPYAAPADRAPRDTIKVLSEFDKNGRAQKVETFADGLNIPMGLYPYRDGVICFSIPNIWHLRDTDGDGRADKRDVLYGPFDTTRDTHGMCNAFRRGLDGWVYACHGFNNQSSVAGTDGNRVEMQSGNTFRFRIDGSRIEHFTNGQVNPFGMAFDRNGDVFTADCHTKPINLLLQGGHHDSFGKPHDGLGYIPNVLEHLHNSTGIGGIALGRGSGFPDEYQTSTFGGNVVTARINRNMLEYNGSSMRAVEQADFLACDDPWFRPVDLLLGPDGSLYFADFYNRIIGHYEVPLDHPGRDRFRGRIWRIVYRGVDGIERPESREDSYDLSRLSSSQLIARLSSENVSLASLVVDRLTDDVASPELATVANRLRKVVYDSANGMQRANALRALGRLGVMDRADIEFAIKASDPQLRRHAFRMLASTENAFGADLIAAGFLDTDAIVQRAAVQAAAVHCREAFVKPLFVLYGETVEVDRYLRHAIRISLRNHLRNEAWFARLVSRESAGEDLVVGDSAGGGELLIRICMALKTPAAGEFIAGNVKRLTNVPLGELTERLKFAARYAKPSTVAGLVETIQDRYSKDVPTQLSLLNAFRDGAVAGGIEVPDEIRGWATALARELLHVPSGDASASRPLRWTFVPHNVGDKNPWVPSTKRQSVDEQTSLLFSSFPNGEQRTGTYRSTWFELKDTFRFHLAGHDGAPDKPLQGENWVRIRDADTNDVLYECGPPRDDVAQLVEWQTGGDAGKRAFVELIDNNSGPAFAWFAVGRFSVPGLNPSFENLDRKQAVDVVATFQLKSLLPDVGKVLRSGNVDRPTMASMFRCVAALTRGTERGARVVADALAVVPTIQGATDELLDLVCDLLLAKERVSSDRIADVLESVMDVSSELEQVWIAESLAGPGGADFLLGVIESGHASPRILTVPTVRPKLEGLSESQRARVASLTDQLPSEDETVVARISELRQAYSKDGGDVAAGRKVFAEHCQVCHRIGDQGKQVGPNLDGIGNRGLYRLTEDIYAPSRNIDAGFVSSLVATTDGQSHLGLLKDKDGPEWLLVNLKGEEVRIPVSSVEERTVSRVSPMPGNFSALLSMEKSRDLIAFLLNQAGDAKR